jgi:hypothetical protein
MSKQKRPQLSPGRFRGNATSKPQFMRAPAQGGFLLFSIGLLVAVSFPR